jgi:hypothetical protein
VVPTLQVKVSEEQLVGLKTYARNNGTTMTELAAAWIDGLLAGTNTSSSPTSSASSSGSSSAIGQPAEAEHLQLLSRQVELLERLVALQEAHTPYGGTGAVAATESEPALRPQVSGLS